MTARISRLETAVGTAGEEKTSSALSPDTLKKLGHEVLRLTEAFAWISRNGHDLVLWRGNTREIFGRDLPEGATFDEILPAFSRAGRSALRQAIIRCLNSGEPWQLELEVKSGPAKGNWLHASGTAMDLDGVRYLTGVFRNVSAVKHMENRLARETHEKKMATEVLTQLLDIVPNAIAAYDPDDRLIFFNRQYHVYYDRAAPKIRLGEKYENILKFAVEQGQYMNIDPAKARSRKWMEERLARHRKGMKKDLVQQLSSGRWVQVRERKSESGHTVFVSTDITELIEAEKRLRQQAETDPLTGLLNRSRFMSELSDFLTYRKRNPVSGCLILFDLDHFKSINDTLGHQIGDALLQEMAQRIRKTTRATDFAARLGGDEFAIFLPDVHGGTCECVMEKIHAALCQPLELNGSRLHPKVSMGVALVTEEDDDADGLLRKTDTALIQAKKEGRNNWRNFDETLQRKRERRRRIINGLREAISSHAIEIGLQPQINLNDRSHAGFEVLARWEHEGETISPAEFIPIAESTGMIMEIGRLVMARALGWLSSMKASGLNPGRLAINISPVQLKCERFFHMLDSALEMYGITPEELELEITETAIITRDEALLERNLRRLADRGFQISLDDFGTGNATFAHLKRFPISRLKIDKSFVDDIGRKSESTIITLAVINLAHNLGMDVIAEGIETREQSSFLQINGCDYAQGFFFSRPLTPTDATEWLRKHRAGDGTDPLQHHLDPI